MTSLLRLLLAALAALLLGLMAAPGPATAVPATPAHAYTYDPSVHIAPSVDVARERGPPATSNSASLQAVRLGSYGASVRQDGPTPHIGVTYDDPAGLVPVAQPTGTAGEQARGVDGDRGSLAPTGVAANNVPTVVFSRSRAPGIAGNFDNAVANGAPTRLTRVDAAARDANRRAALRGQSPAPAGQSLDEYPFACSAQGGCGSFISRVPVGEQSYQGGVLSQFFQRSGVQPGDLFDVIFGP